VGRGEPRLEQLNVLAHRLEGVGDAQPADLRNPHRVPARRVPEVLLRAQVVVARLRLRQCQRGAVQAQARVSTGSATTGRLQRTEVLTALKLLPVPVAQVAVVRGAFAARKAAGAHRPSLSSLSRGGNRIGSGGASASGSRRAAAFATWPTIRLAA
jgi:hypothetical protein